MYQIELKKVLLTALCAVSAVGASASDWVGESRLTSTTTYYLYNVKAKKYLGNNNSVAPALVESSSNAILFTVGYSTSTSGVDWNFKYTYDNANYYLNSNDNFYSSSTSDVTNYGVEHTGSDTTIFYLGFKKFTISLFNSKSSYYYLMYNGSELKNVNSKEIGDISPDQWKQISESQFKYRPLLDAMLAKAISYQASLQSSDENYTALETAISNAETALTTSACEAAYTSLTAAYNKAIAGADYSTAAKTYQSTISQGYVVFYALQAKMGKIPTSLQTILTNAEKTLSAANEVVSASGATSDDISEQTSSLTSAVSSLAAAIQTYTDPNVLYAGEMKAFSEKLGYPFPESDVNALLNAVEANDSAAIHSAIVTAQDKFKSWVNTQVGNKTGFPKNSDMTCFILNNSFETGNTWGWATGDDNTKVNSASSTTSSSTTSGGITYKTTTYSLTDNEIYTQTLKGLPKGSYKLSVSSGTGSVSPEFFTIDDSNKGVTITIQGTSIDAIKLTLVEGAASVYSFTETDGVDESTVRAGSFSTVTVTRKLKADTNENWNTFCSPSSISNAEAIGTEENPGLFSQIMEMTGVQQDANGITLLYTSSDSIVAGKAYLVKARSEVTEYTATNANVVKSIVSADYSSNNEKVKVVMVGTFAPLAAGAIPYLTGVDIKTAYGMDGVARTYILQSNTFKYLTSASQVSMSAFRAYFHIWEPNSSTFSASTVRMSFEEAGEETCIANVNVNSSSDQIFDLNGHKVSAMTNGLYVKDGKKVFINK